MGVSFRFALNKMATTTLSKRAKCLHALAQAIPSKLRGRLLFGGIHRQSLVQRAIGGRALVSIRLRDRLRFQCWTDEKYFWLGDDFDADLLPAIKEVAAGMDTVYDIGAHAGFY